MAYLKRVNGEILVATNWPYHEVLPQFKLSSLPPVPQILVLQITKSPAIDFMDL